jgi:hypothetical protein
LFKWLLILLVVFIAIYIANRKRGEIFDSHRLEKDLEKWKTYKKRMRNVAKERELGYKSDRVLYGDLMAATEEDEGEQLTINQFFPTDEEQLTLEEFNLEEYTKEYYNKESLGKGKRIVKKKRWRWKGWRR